MSIAQSSNFWNPWTLSNQGSPWVPWVPAHLISLEAFGKYGAWAEALQLLQEMCHDWKRIQLGSENDEKWSENGFHLERSLSKWVEKDESLGIMLNYVYAPQNKRLVSFSWKLLDRFWNRPTCPARSMTQWHENSQDPFLQDNMLSNFTWLVFF